MPELGCLGLLREAAAELGRLSTTQREVGDTVHELSLSGTTTTPAVELAAQRSSAVLAPASPDQIAADEAVVAADQADVAEVNEELAAAELTSPISGTVVAINVTPGGSVTGAATSAPDVVVLGAGGFDVATTVTVTDRAEVAVGDRATVTPDGATTPLAGSVASIGLLPTTSGATVDYPVVIRLAGAPTGLVPGAGAQVSIVVRHSAHALAVPTSAVHSIGTRSYVRVLSGAQLRVVSVTVNAVGATYTAVRSPELKVGERVVLADLATALPSGQAGVPAARFAAGGGTVGGGNFGGAGAFTGQGAGRGG